VRVVVRDKMPFAPQFLGGSQGERGGGERRRGKEKKEFWVVGDGLRGEHSMKSTVILFTSRSAEKKEEYFHKRWQAEEEKISGV